MTNGEPFLAPGLRTWRVRMIEDDNQQFLGGGRGCHRSTRTEARALQAEFSERSRLRKTATKPAEFSGPNRSTQSYGIRILLQD
jgi:hypothetical protein